MATPTTTLTVRQRNRVILLNGLCEEEERACGWAHGGRRGCELEDAGASVTSASSTKLEAAAAYYEYFPNR